MYISILLLAIEVLSNLRRGRTESLIVILDAGGDDLDIQVFPILDLSWTKLDSDPSQSTQKVMQSGR